MSSRGRHVTRRGAEFRTDLGRRLTDFDADDTEEDEYPAEKLNRAGQLAEEQPREDHGRDDLDQRDEGREPRAEDAGRGDAENIGHRGGDEAECEQWRPPRQPVSGVCRVRRRRCAREHACAHQRAEDGRAHEQAAGGERDRREAVVGVGGDDEVRRGSDHRPDAPERASQADRRVAGEEVENQHEAEAGHRCAHEGHPAGTLAVEHPQPEDDGGWSGVFDEQRRPDRHVRDCGEVAELRAGDGQHAIQQQGAPGLAQDRPVPAKSANSEWQQHDRGHGHPDRDDSGGIPARVEQSPRERA